MHQWLLDVFDVFIERRNDHGYEEDARLDPTVLPGWVYARALALRMVENASKTQVLSSNLQVWIQTLEAQIVERIIRKVRWH